MPAATASQVLSAPVVGTASNIGSSGFTANWTPVGNCISYTVKVYWGMTFVDSTNVSGQSSSNVAVSKLIPNTTFTYKVLARGDGVNFTDSPLSASSASFTLLTAPIPANKLKVILKLDDIAIAGYAPEVMAYLKANNIKAGYGVVAKYLNGTSLSTLLPYINATNSVGDSLVEIWNHGYDHSHNSTISYEFKNMPYADQKSHLDDATSDVKSILGIQMHSFGAPYNNTDATTNAVLLTNPNYKVFMFSQVKSTTDGIFYMSNRVQMETTTGTPLYNLFISKYNTYKNTYKDYMLLEGHPNYYTTGSSNFDQFKLILQFLISEGVEFVRQYDYYRYLSLKAPTNLIATPVSANRIDLSWTDNSTTENNFRIERSNDNINWTIIGSSPANTITYSDNSVSAATYYYKVNTSCGISSDYSNVVKVINSNTAVLNLSGTPDIKVYQSQNALMVKGTKNSDQQQRVELINSSGQRIKTWNDELSGEYTFSKNIADIKRGIYLCKLLSDNQQQTYKIIIQ